MLVSRLLMRFQLDDTSSARMKHIGKYEKGVPDRLKKGKSVDTELWLPFPDESIFEEISFDYQILSQRLKELAF